jgi:2-oxoglutarate ferredoxin oxidoreductase subunit gamma
MKDDKHVTWIPSYGAEMRGGTANCSVKVSDKYISSPFVYQLDALVALNEPSLEKFVNSVKPNGLIVINSTIVPKKDIRNDVNVVRIPATDIAVELGNIRAANIVILGALLNKLPIVPKELLLDVVRDFFSGKGSNVIELNENALNAGYEFKETAVVTV